MLAAQTCKQIGVASRPLSSSIGQSGKAEFEV